MEEYDTECMGQVILTDDREKITAEIRSFAEDGADLILCSGGMSVDPDDRTPGAIRDTGAEVVSYGAPVLPGAMFLLAYLDQGDRVVPVLGLPGCIMYAKRTIFDLVLPRVLAGERLGAEDLCRYGEGGLCLSCPVCHFPNCQFGK
jgi:molybdopterin biosynthesis enzyme